MTFLGLEPRIVFLPTSQLEYLQKSAVLDKKKFEFSTFERKFCVENSFSGFHYKIVQQLLNLGKNPYYSSGDNPSWGHRYISALKTRTDIRCCYKHHNSKISSDQKTCNNIIPETMSWPLFLQRCD
jgi:hypothetical protein